MKLGDWKGINTGNDLDKIKYLKRHNSKFKRNIKSLNKKVTQKKYDRKGDENE